MRLPVAHRAVLFVDEAAYVMACTRPVITQLCTQGQLRAYKLDPTARVSEWRIYKDSLAEHVRCTVEELEAMLSKEKAA